MFDAVSRMQRALLAVAAGVTLLASGCTSGGGVATARPTSSPTTIASTSSAAPTIAPHPAPVSLTCDTALRYPPGAAHVPHNKQWRVAGLISRFLDPAGIASSLGPQSRLPTFDAANGRYTEVKSVLYVTPQAAPETTITLLGPPAARLNYTGWVATGKALPGATTQVTVPSCGHDTVAHRGVVLVAGPTCLTYRVSGTRTVTGHVPIGRTATCS